MPRFATLPRPPRGVIIQSLSGTESSQDSPLLVSWLAGTGDVSVARWPVPPVPPVRPVPTVVTLPLLGAAEEGREGCMAASSPAVGGWEALSLQLQKRRLLDAQTR